MNPSELAVLGALSTSRVGLSERELASILAGAGVSDAGATARLRDGGRIAARGGVLELTPEGIRALLDVTAEIEAALDPSPLRASEEECPSVPWLTTVQTCWIDAVSINYAVEPSVVAKMLPPPLEPEVFKGSAWIQVLMSSLRDMRPQGLPSLFGVCFYQASYRAAVAYTARDGTRKRGGYFVRSETNHPVMRAVGNRLVEFRFHDFGAAEMFMLREGDNLTIGVEPEPAGGKIVGLFDTRPSDAPPPGSVWRSLDELFEPLVECYDAYGVDRESRFLYILTIDRDPWKARFVKPLDLYVEYAERGPIAGHARLDSVLHVRECPYRWRPLRRERF